MNERLGIRIDTEQFEPAIAVRKCHKPGTNIATQLGPWSPGLTRGALPTMSNAVSLSIHGKNVQVTHGAPAVSQW
jgi:hypothetical protein